MTNSGMDVLQGVRRGAVAYTVIGKSGQRGTVYDDPDLAAQAFHRAREQDRPFVLRHRGNATCVIASARAGAKQVSASWGGDDIFRTAYESLAANDQG